MREEGMALQGSSQTPFTAMMAESLPVFVTCVIRNQKLSRLLMAPFVLERYVYFTMQQIQKHIIFYTVS